MGEFLITPANFTSYLKDVPSEELFVMERQVLELEETAGWQLVKNLVATKRVATIAELERGVLSPEQTARRTGGMVGMQAAYHAVEGVKSAARRAREQIESMPSETVGEGG